MDGEKKLSELQPSNKKFGLIRRKFSSKGLSLDEFFSPFHKFIWVLNSVVKSLWNSFLAVYPASCIYLLGTLSDQSIKINQFNQSVSSILGLKSSIKYQARKQPTHSFIDRQTDQNTM